MANPLARVVMNNISSKFKITPNYINFDNNKIANLTSEEENIIRNLINKNENVNINVTNKNFCTIDDLVNKVKSKGY